MPQSETTNNILLRLRKRLARVERKLVALWDPPAGEMRDLINAIAIDGRTVTFILQNLRNVEPDFDNWYGPFVQEMRSDELLVFFKDLRNMTEKKGEDRIHGVQFRPAPGSTVQMSAEGFRISYLDAEGQREFLTHGRPKNTVSSFIGDNEGGAGFVVRHPDGTERKHYVYLPSRAADISLIFSNPPGSHRGSHLANRSPVRLCELYVDYLRHIVSSAEEKYGE